MPELLTSLLVQDFISQNIETLKASASDLPLALARQRLQEKIETATRLQLGYRNRAALRAFIADVSRQLRTGEVGDFTSYTSTKQLITAALSNSPDLLKLGFTFDSIDAGRHDRERPLVAHTASLLGRS